MMKVTLRKARMQVQTKFEAHGSVLAQTVSSSCQGVKYRLEVESDESPERIAGLIRNAENGCFAMSAIKAPVEVKGEVLLNGKGINLAEYPPPQKEA